MISIVRRRQALALGLKTSQIRPRSCRSAAQLASHDGTRTLSNAAPALHRMSYLMMKVNTESQCSHNFQRRSFASAVPEHNGDDASSDKGISPSAIPFLCADIGEGIYEVEIMQWLVKEGDEIQEFDNVCEVQSDKATVMIPSRYDGTVDKLCGNVQDMIKVGEPLMYIIPKGPIKTNPAQIDESQPVPPPAKLFNVSDEDVTLHIPPVGKGNLQQPPPISHQDDRDSYKVLTSPAVRKLAKEHDIHLPSVIGTGPGGRILKQDILQIIGATSNQSTCAPQTTADGQESLSSSTQTPFMPASSSIADMHRLEQQEEMGTLVPLRGYSRHMYKTMTKSLEVPHMTFGDEVRMTKLVQMRETLKMSGVLSKYQLPKLTYLPFFLKAASLALTEYPLLNSSLVKQEDDLFLQKHPHHNIGVAIDTPRGLVVAVVNQCDRKSVLEIQQDLVRLEVAARNGSLTEQDVTGATFAISNIGVLGGTYMTPIVVPPTVAIGAVGKIDKVPKFITSDKGDEDRVVAVHIMNVSWAADHRVVDGATLARFSNSWKQYLEEPSLMIFTMT